MESIVPIIKLNYDSDIYFQEDNSPVHKARKVKLFMKESEINILEWPAKSPDLNIVEDVWRLISDMVYNGPQFQNNIFLSRKIDEVINVINTTETSKLLDLYGQIRKRLCKVLQRKGRLYNKNK